MFIFPQQNSNLKYSPKTYILGDKDDFKRLILKTITYVKFFFSSSKGVPHSLVIPYELYLKSLYDPKFKLIKTYFKLQYAKSVSSMTLMKTSKSALTSRYTKMYMSDDLVSCCPHEGNC